MRDTPQISKKWTKGMKRIAIVYPNEYYGGIYNLGILVIYNLVNSLEGWICERRFIDSEDLGSFDLVGFSWQYELDLKNIKKLREQVRGVCFAGGPAVNSNYKPLEGVVDFFVLGEVEEIMEKILECYDDVSELKKIKGVFIPDVSKKKECVVVKNLDGFYPLFQPMPISEGREFVFGKCFMLEIERGCPFNCKFCALKDSKVRYRNLEKIKEIIDEGLLINNRKRIVIYSASFTHPKKKEILEYLVSKNIRFSIPSIRIETVNEEIMELVYAGGQRSITIAPECGEGLRKSLGKFVKDKDFFEFGEMCSRVGFKDVKLYFMVGIPKQDNSDLDSIIKFINEFKDWFGGKVYVSFNPFVAKKGTALEGYEFNSAVVKKQISYLRKRLKVRAKFGSVKTAEKVWKIANT